MRKKPLRLVAALAVLAGSFLAGCAFEPRVYRRAEIKKPFKSRPAEPQIIRGRKNIVIDSLGHYLFSLPAKLVLWNWSVERHQVSEENEASLQKYMEVNGLSTTLVRLNTYAPHKEFARLKKNKDVNAIYKYTLGSISVVFYTLLPERVFAGLFGGDHYNPFTNTINIYSDHPAILVHEGGHARDFAKRNRRGTYAFIRLIPFVDLYQEYIASQDAIDYFYCREDNINELNAYPILIPAYATYIAKYLPSVIGGGVIIVAHVHGRLKRAERRRSLAGEPKGNFRGTCLAEGEGG